MTSQRGSRKVGLARAISKLGYCSRSRARDLIDAGRVKLNGATTRDFEAPVHIGRDRIEVDGQQISTHAKRYLMLNKPRGVVTTATDEKGRETVYEYLSRDLSWVSPVGRLDKASEGLLLFTNDSEWAARITAPEIHLEKIYHVQIAARPDSPLLEGIAQGSKTKDGDYLRVKNVRVLRRGGRNTWLEIVLDEGKNRHIRRLLAHFGIVVLRLVRVAIGPLQLGDLQKGAFRSLTASEKSTLDRAMNSAAKLRSA